MSTTIHAARGTLRKVLIAGLLAAFVGVPSLAQARAIAEPAGAIHEAAGGQPGAPAPRDPSAGEAAAYAAREAAAPGLGAFAGGDGGVYIGGGVVTVLLIVLLIVLIV